MSVDVVMDKIIVNKNFVKFNNTTWQISNNSECISSDAERLLVEDRIRGIICTILMDRVYNAIHVYKRCPGSGKPAIKSCIFYDETGNEDLLIISDKQYVPAIKEELKEIGLTYSKPNGGKNRKLLNNNK